MEFLKHIAQQIYNNHRGSFDRLTIVLPTRRASLFLKNYLGELVGDTPICLPQFTTISDLFDTLCKYKAVDEIKAVCTLYSIYCEEMKDIMPAEKIMSLDCFYGWGRQLISDFNNVDKNVLDTKSENIFESAMEAHSFDKPYIDEDIRQRIVELIRGKDFSMDSDEDSVFVHFQKVWSKLPTMYSRLKEALAQENYALEGARYKWVTDNFDTIWPEICDSHFVIAGFNLLLGTERKLLHLLKDKGCATFFWDYDADFDTREPFINAYHRVKKNLDEFGGDCGNGNASTDIGNKEIHAISASSDTAQARYVNQWLKKYHRQGEKTAVVLCNEGMLQPVVFSIPAEMSDNVNITKGFPLKHTQIYSALAGKLDEQRKATGDFDKILSKLIDFIDNRQNLAAETNTADDGGDPLPTEWYDLLDRESAYQARCVLVRFRQLICDGTLAMAKDFLTLRNLIRNHLQTINIPFHGEPITDIQIIGVLETRTLDFDNLLLLNVEEGVVPRTGHDNSFIPYYLRKYYGLTTNDEQTEVYAHNFFRLLRCAKHISLLFSEAQIKERQATMSRFVMQILTSKTLAPIVKRHLLTEGNKTVSTADEDQRTKLLRLTPHSNYFEKINGDNASLSPSAINTFLKCRMLFFLKYMLNLQEPSDDSSLFQANDLGTLIHESIRAAYMIMTRGKGVGQIPGATIGAFLNDDRNLSEAIDHAYANMNKDYKERRKLAPTAPDVYIRAEHPIETTVALAHLRKVLRNDKSLVGFTIHGNEKKIYLTLPLEELGTIHIGGSIDRLDSVVEGGERVVRIVDYKTGSYNQNKMTAKSFDEIFSESTHQGYVLQTMIYSLACIESDDFPQECKDKRIVPILLFTQRNLDKFDPHLKIGEDCVADFRTLKDEFKTRLTSLVREILTTTDFSLASLDGNDSPCPSCPFVLLCGRQNMAKTKE